jgi:hypothetical protein
MGELEEARTFAPLARAGEQPPVSDGIAILWVRWRREERDSQLHRFYSLLFHNWHCLLKASYTFSVIDSSSFFLMSILSYNDVQRIF